MVTNNRFFDIQNISILGCGWLGFPLALTLKAKGYFLQVSTTDLNKYSFLKNYFSQTYRIAFTPQVNLDFVADFFTCDLLIVNVPPKIKDLNSAQYYLAILNNILSLIEKSQIKSILFISTTSVYENKNCLLREEDTSPVENRNQLHVNNELPIQSNFKKNLILLKAENLFKKYCQKKKKALTILRLAGLIDGKETVEDLIKIKKDNKQHHPQSFFSIRKPQFFWKNLTTLPHEIPVNWIHRKDVITIIEKIISQNYWGEIYNLCSDHHPTKRMIYRLLYNINDLKPLKKNNDYQNYKVIDNTKVKKKLDYSFLYPNPLQMLE